MTPKIDRQKKMGESIACLSLEEEKVRGRIRAHVQTFGLQKEVNLV
jgi:hypothetical protein